jgi:hypothetical protein
VDTGHVSDINIRRAYKTNNLHLHDEDFEFTFLVINTFSRPMLYAEDFYIKLTNVNGADGSFDTVVLLIVVVIVVDVVLVASLVKCILIYKLQPSDKIKIAAS